MMMMTLAASAHSPAGARPTPLAPGTGLACESGLPDAGSSSSCLGSRPCTTVSAVVAVAAVVTLAAAPGCRLVSLLWSHLGRHHVGCQSGSFRVPDCVRRPLGLLLAEAAETLTWAERDMPLLEQQSRTLPCRRPSSGRERSAPGLICPGAGRAEWTPCRDSGLRLAWIRHCARFSSWAESSSRPLPDAGPAPSLERVPGCFADTVVGPLQVLAGGS